MCVYVFCCAVFGLAAYLKASVPELYISFMFSLDSNTDDLTELPSNQRCCLNSKSAEFAAG
jgi:hypothetical protein